MSDHFEDDYDLPPDDAHTAEEEHPPSRPQFSLALLFELKALLGMLLAVPLIGRALFTAAAIMAIFILVQLPLFWLFGAFRISADEGAS